MFHLRASASRAAAEVQENNPVLGVYNNNAYTQIQIRAVQSSLAQAGRSRIKSTERAEPRRFPRCGRNSSWDADAGKRTGWKT